ncbi:MAG TPA: hypothetical protein VJX70_06645 [Candidatus Acidoferrum sp.]|nr:hypothetical protein [Candidatus Acidoferrum sp.]
MQEILQDQKPSEKEKLSPTAVLLSVLVLAAVAFGLWHILKPTEGPAPRTALTDLPAKMSSAEEAYARNIRIENVALSRAENFIRQEVTILNADAVNGGPQSIASLSVTVEFSDDLHQVVLRERRGVSGTPPAVLGAGQSRHFEISFDRVPSSWNMQQPSVQVTHLQLSPLK